MRSRKGTGGGGIVGGILAVILLGLILFMTVSPGDDGDDDEVLDSDGLFVMLDTNPPELTISKETGSYNWTEHHTNIELNGLPVTEGMRLADKASVKQGWFSEDKFTYKFMVQNNTVDASLFFNVLDEGGGTLKVHLNNENVFSRKASTGEEIEIKVPGSKLLPGEENKLDISVSKPFWPWGENSYEIEGIFIDENLYDEEAATKNITISLDDDHVIGMSTAKLTADVELLEDVENKKLTILLNGEEIYNNVPGAVHGAVDESLPIRSFNTGDNILTFKTELNGGYSVDFTLRLEVLNLTQESYEIYEVKIADNVWPYIEACQEGKDYVGEMYIKRSSGADAITVWINDRMQSLAFDASNEISQNVCGFLEKGKNTIMLIADTDGTSDHTFIDVERLRLEIREK